jgi:thiol:disulfide interchange protein
MRTVRSLLIACLLALCIAPSCAQGGKATFTGRLEPKDARAGEGAQVVITGTIQPEWHIYSLTLKEGGLPTVIALPKGEKALVTAGKPVQPPPRKIHDETLNLDLEEFEGKVAFGLPVKVAANAKGSVKATVEVTYQACNPSVCDPPKTVKVPVSFTIAAGPARPDRLKPVTTVPKQPDGAKKAEGVETSGSGPTAGTTSGTPPGNGANSRNALKDAQEGGLLRFIWFALIAGFAALLTPCVFPMIPITVSYFAKQRKPSESGGSLLAGPIAYCLGIIGTFTALGILFAVVFGAANIQSFAAHPVTNIGMAILFIVMAANLFGVFEIQMPGWLVSKAQSGTRREGFAGPVFMGLAFTLTSFTCTVPFVGTLLVAASKEGLFYPIVGMLAFSTAFALPFFLLALFPQYLARMPKSGSWLTSVKAFMGFIELAAALKFISNVDVAWQWEVITRPVFLAIWAGICVVAALYLWGWLKLPHDDASVRIGIPRRILGLATAAAGVIFLAAMNGLNLGQLEAFPPPPTYGKQNATVGPVAWLHDYDKALAVAKAQNKPLFINFTGWT